MMGERVKGVDLRPIPFSDRYEVGDDGYVYSKGKRLRPWSNNRFGHLKIGLRVGGQTVRVFVHRVVACVFHGSPPFQNAEVRHLDGNPTNNVPSNLTWGSHAENMADMTRHGRTVSRPEMKVRMPRGGRHGSKTKPESVKRGAARVGAKLNDKLVRTIRQRSTNGATAAGMAREYNVSRWLIRRIVSGEAWNHV